MLVSFWPVCYLINIFGEINSQHNGIDCEKVGRYVRAMSKHTILTYSLFDFCRQDYTIHQSRNLNNLKAMKKLGIIQQCVYTCMQMLYKNLLF